MIIIELIKMVIQIAKGYPTQHPIATWILAGIYLVLAAWIIIVSVMSAKGATAKILTFFYSLIRVACMMLASFVFFVGGAEATLDYGYLVNRLYIEAIISTVLFAGASVLVEVLKGKPDEEDDNDYDEIGKAILKGILFTAVSLVFLFTKLDSKLIGFGFVIFKRSIGDWILTWYLAAAVWAVLGLVQKLVNLFFMLILRKPGRR